MAFEVPTDLIRQVQIALRNDAGLSSYDPLDPTLPSLPSLEASIAGFDLSPAYLRCKHCKGRLLRGIQSIICIYCGKQQNKDVPPDAISFKSTFGYRWLLQSLDLDGSEIVEPEESSSRSCRGQSMPKEEIPLSDLLDLKITWPVESEKSETSAANKTLEQSKSSLNLTGVDLDNYFSGSKGHTFSNAPQEKPAINQHGESIENRAFSDQDNLFQNVQSSETGIRSSEDDTADTSGWEADFQSAGFGNQHEGSQLFDPFMGSAVDLSGHMDSAFGPGKELKNGKTNNDSAPPSAANDWIGDELWNNVNSVASQQAEQSDATVKAKDGLTLDDSNNPSSMGVDWSQDAQWKTENTNGPNNKTNNDDDDSFDEWNAFTSSSGAQDPSGKDWKQSSDQIGTVNKQTSETSILGATNEFQEMDFGSFSQLDLIPSSSNNQNGSAEVDFLTEILASDRIDDARSKAGGNAGEVVKNGDVVTTTTQSNDDVEMLMSQMHDLSFMLQSNLSVPSTLDGLRSSSQD